MKKELDSDSLPEVIKYVLLVLLLLGIAAGTASAAQEQPPLPTSYWGYVTENGVLKSGISITVHDAAGTGIASATSNQDGLYQVTVPWDNPDTTQDEGVVEGETITIRTNGRTATSRKIDEKGTNNRLDLSVPAASSGGSSSGGGSSGSGGGGVTSGENFTNIEKTETRDNSLIADKPVTYNFTLMEKGIYEIVVTGKENENDVSIRVERLKGISSLVNEPAPGVIYYYFNIWTNTKKIKEGFVRFKVENSWITSKGLANKDVKLFRWDGSRWIQLETTEKSKDANHTYYEARTETFSSFAISGVKEDAATTATPGTTVTGAPIATPTTTSTAATTPPVKAPAIPAWITMIVIFAASVYFLVMRKNKGGK
ncbi:hypothetical protein ANME2D_02650 [Candidatus Methanoperedens nitroreducens]|uniref:PGF-pre-PGF domain-containing protein n=1 Tax=Candidatus Methanoperedens nitratireducens TaxID=1392998 RepID=A0A062V487_9EURY|nr:PGF-pre-PGF domain-containing protein [Candidatus Methanoperedens nitroreducens]KCZ70629.1 hypothetical protein ANME2D_02650 [Candidatus Methanoperedens nitroreducens]MDJ1420485.1 PGF-pre-PGF domain-containing protein [Candidatus Methanoperedens sp.]